MANPIRWGLGAALGDGKQFMSWIHLDDLCAAFIKCVEDPQMRGVYNAAGSNPVTNLEVTRMIARVLARPLWLPPIPAFALKLMLGERAMLVTTGSRVSSSKIQQTGFTFQYNELESALRDLFKASQITNQTAGSQFKFHSK
jgi:NAD dependent epimerase/dehydratase family enzyme